MNALIIVIVFPSREARCGVMSHVRGEERKKKGEEKKKKKRKEREKRDERGRRSAEAKGWHEERSILLRDAVCRAIARQTARK
jgi:hypothetical protein